MNKSESRHLSAEIIASISIFGVAFICILVSSIIILCHIYSSKKKNDTKVKQDSSQSQVRITTNLNMNTREMTQIQKESPDNYSKSETQTPELLNDEEFDRSSQSRRLDVSSSISEIEKPEDLERQQKVVKNATNIQGFLPPISRLVTGVNIAN
mmetsp:Transcript_8587/g.7612  ORF Transcript_8587/g.7612 Transcript_8587/m.7612 type:complete len:154 (+) Transcript_8587:36-497(+)